MLSFPGQPVLVVAAGRCGTSYLTSFLQANGIDIGRDLIGGHAINPHGFFENRRIVEFHMKILARESPADAEGPLLQPFYRGALTHEDEKEALRIAGEAATPGCWGWKDPRTIHFIDFWLRVLPNAKLIIPIRHPLEVFYSYIKRIPATALFDPAGTFFPAYVRQYEKLLEIAQRQPGCAYVLEIQSAFRQPEQLWRDLSALLGRDEMPVRLVPFYEKELARLRLTASACEAFHRLFPDASSAFWKLNQRAPIGFCFAETGFLEESNRESVLRMAAHARTPDELLPFLLRCCLQEEDDGGYLQALRALYQQLASAYSALQQHSRNLERHAGTFASR